MKPSDARLPFVLTATVPIERTRAPQPHQIYRHDIQLWFDTKLERPVVEVLCISSDMGSSDIGETLLTATREGADQSEVSDDSVLTSDFGETTGTRTAEGADQSEIIGHPDFDEIEKAT